MVDNTFIIPDIKEDPVFPSLNDAFSRAPEGGAQLLDDNWLTKDRTRNSLGVLSNEAFHRDSPAEKLVSPRESLGILNISAIDLGNESEAIWGFKSPIIKKTLNGPIPHILIANMKEPANSAVSLTLEQNGAFPPTNVNKISNSSSVSSDPSVGVVSPLLNTRSLQELSFVYSHKMDSDSNEISPIAVSDSLNNAFRVSENIYSVSCRAANRPQNFTEDLIKIKHRIRLLPGVLQADTFNSNSMNVDKNVLANSSIAEGGLDLNDSIFIQAESGQNQNEVSFNDERYLLDSTPQPEWSADFDSSASSSEVKPQIYGNEDIAKMIDRMFGTQPANLQDRVKLISGTKGENVSPVDVCSTQQASKVSCQSSISEDCNDNDNHLKTVSDQKNLSVIIKNLSDIINGNENLSNSQKEDGHHILKQLFNLLSNHGDQDSGHSSAAEEKFGESDDRTENNESKQPCLQPISPYMNFQRELVVSSKPVNKPVRNSDGKKIISNCTSSASSNNVVSGSVKRPKTLSKFQPLRATVPVENMVRDHVVPILVTSNKNVQVTPDRKRPSSTPTQEPKLRKPMAASTPTGKETKLASVIMKPSSPSLITGRASMSSKTVPGNKKSNSLPNSELPMFVRNNSLCENQLKCLKDRRDSGIPAFKRRSSIGEGSKVKNVLSRVRENLLNSPHFKGTSEELANSGNKVPQMTKAEKENMRPAY